MNVAGEERPDYAAGGPTKERGKLFSKTSDTWRENCPSTQWNENSGYTELSKSCGARTPGTTTSRGEQPVPAAAPPFHLPAVATHRPACGALRRPAFNRRRAPPSIWTPSLGWPCRELSGPGRAEGSVFTPRSAHLGWQRAGYGGPDYHPARPRPSLVGNGARRLDFGAGVESTHRGRAGSGRTRPENRPGPQGSGLFVNSSKGRIGGEPQRRLSPPI